MKSSIPVLLGLLGASYSANAELIITEYIEGSSNNKAIEVSNLGKQNINLKQDKYRLELFSNGKTSTTNGLDLQGILPPNASLVIYNSGAAVEFKKATPAGIASNVTAFNGDDAIVLTKAGVVVDSFGRKGEDPGKAWTDGNDSEFTTTNKTLRRLAHITQGDTLVDDAFPNQDKQWAVFDINSSDGLGCSGIDACTGNEPKPIADDSNPGDGDGDSDSDSLCLNCPDITKVADASKFIASDYYANALQADKAMLHTAINKIISANHHKLSYSEVWSVLTYSDQDPSNKDNVILLYSGKSIAKKLNGSGAQSANQDAWNREHVWSKSHGFPKQSQLAYTDAHHLRPADVSMNSTRSNYDFADGGSAVEESPLNYYNTTLRTWQPREAVKGDVARMMFYMDVRYDGASTDNTPDLKLVDKIGTENGSATFGKLCTLYDWHLTDPVDATEQRRNNAVYEYQGNRNPFIDHPEWISQLWGPICDGNQSAPKLTIKGDTNVVEGAELTLQASGSTTIENASLNYKWRYLSGPKVAISADTATLRFIAPEVSQDTPLVIEVTVTDGMRSTTEQVTVTIKNKVETQSDDASSGTFGQYLISLLILLTLRRRAQK